MRPVRSFRSIAAAAVLAAAASLLVAAPANAETQSTYDPIGDTTFQGDANFPGRDGVEDSVDIRRLRADYEGKTLLFSIKVADLTLASSDYTVVGASVLTGDGRSFYAGFEGQGESPDRQLSESGVGEIRCRGLKLARSEQTDYYQMTIPRSCIGDPETLRFGARVRISDLQSGNPACCPNSYSDDARRDGNLGKRIRLGTRTLTYN